MKERNTIILLIGLLIYCTSMRSKTQDSILYILPDKVEIKLSEYIESNISQGLNWKFYLATAKDGMYNIYISSFKGEITDYWYNNTNRFVMINTEYFPLILDYDSAFSTKNPCQIGKYGKREGQILRTVFLYEGYSVTFDKNGEHIKENLGIYQKE